MKPVLPEGYSVTYRHERETLPNGEVSPRGGRTAASVYDEGDHLVASGEAIVNPKDNFNRRIGRDVSLGRALKGLR